MIEEIKGRISSKEYAQNHLNLEVKNDRTYSLDKGKNQTCLQFFDDGGFYDYKTGLHGDVIDLCMHYRHKGNKSEAIKELAGILGLEYHKPKQGWQEYMDWQMHKIYTWHDNLKPEHRDYIKARRITDKTINDLKIGSNDDGIVIPYQKNGYCPYYISRSVEGKRYKKQKRDSFNEHIPWGFHTLNRNQEILHITEGAFDAITLDQEGLSVLSPITGHFSKDQIKDVIKISKTFDRVIISFDGDNAGSDFTKKLAKIYFENNVAFDCCLLPNGMDVNDWYMAKNDISFIDDKIDGITYLGQIFETPESFEYFVMQHARFKSKAVMARLVNSSEHGNKQLEKMACAAPTAKTIIEAIKKKYTLRYHNKVGFRQYIKGCWKLKHDGEIEKLIHIELAHHSEGGKIGSCLKALKAEVNSNIEYNEKQIFNFQNGVLELNTGKFREHREDDNSTIQAGYNYDPTAQNDAWEEFLNGVTGDDEYKKELLKEYSGYVLCPTNFLQKCLVLVGHGNNGKSKFLDVLIDVYGFDNVTNISMGGFTQNFEKIFLKDSLLNLNSEESSDVKGAEEEFKKIAVGEMITGCYKGKDIQRFKPRCKIIMSANDVPIPKDDSDGFSRRLMFCTFPFKFTSEPKQANEKPIDLFIYERIVKDLPGVFNWVYQGYKLIMRNKYFTETEEQLNFMGEYKERINPLIIFIKEELLKLECWISTRDMYELYLSWCTKNHKSKKLEYINFSRKIAKTITINFGSEIKKKDKRDGKGYEITNY